MSESARPIATRARFAIAGAASVAVLVAFAVFSVGWSQFVVRQRTAELSRQVVALAAGESRATDPGRSATLRDQLFRVEARLIGATLFVTDAEGAVQRSTASGSPTTLALDRLGPPAASGARSATVRGAGGARVLVVAAPTSDGGYVVAVQRLSEIRAAQAGVLALATLAVLISMLVAWFAGGWLAGRLTAPLRRLEAGAERIAGGELGAQIAEEGDAETLSLARSFNRMSRRVADAYEGQKAFVGDVSHEIRTPLTSIRGFAEALLDGTIADEPGRQRALVVIRDESLRLGELSQTLLALSELDSGAVDVARVPVDPGPIAETLLARFGPLAAERGIALGVEPGDARALGDAERLVQAATTLVANALAYAPDGGRVRVTMGRHGDRFRLCVDDDGPGVPPEAREAVFERFRRVDPSRSAASGGAGLGLAICRRLVGLMDGRVWVEDSELGGARFVIELPLAP